jgi:hypothetical protein
MKVYFEKVHIAQASFYLFISFFLSFFLYFLFGEVVGCVDWLINKRDFRPSPPQNCKQLLYVKIE